MAQFPQLNGNARNQEDCFVSFKAGKMKMEKLENGSFQVSPDLKKGKIILKRGEDQLVHFMWKESNDTIVDDLILFPQDVVFEKVDTGNVKDRVYLLQYKNSDRRFFYWMQVCNIILSLFT